MNKYLQGDIDIEVVKDLALAKGFWSIWMRAFENFPEVQKELIASFKALEPSFLIYKVQTNHNE